MNQAIQGSFTICRLYHASPAHFQDGNQARRNCTAYLEQIAANLPEQT